ncbi:MAG: nucleoside-diphosphate kinase [Eubacteriales bacterium]|nr:nucleoside-diphosphate kinase [Bacillota bacterium]MBV1727960.1 nucleoside-diphosphate kinase [Desulforudis sp.]MDP3051147.1 nucleoside-diphosphate kinase [Eubacteriales bacterium]MDQ7789103.1 nucleoside-diphosphate kinase [Clostridia bacterium]MBU4553503.1 nucleoside-diphosphate kinase [Bacillota bacterium]
MERTFAMVKPDGVQRGLTGQIISRFETRGYKLVGLKLMQISRELAETHYSEHKGKGFFEPLVSYIISGPVVAMVLEGKDVIQGARDMMGATNPAKAAPGTIRATYGIDVGRNIIHGSDSVASAEREIGLFFAPGELTDYSRDVDRWLYE